MRRLVQKRVRTKGGEGYILPMVIILSLVSLASLLVVLQYTTALTIPLHARAVGVSAQAALQAGLDKTLACASDVTSADIDDGTYFSSTLRPNTDCSGTATSAQGNLDNSRTMQTAYTVTKAADNAVGANGGVMRLRVDGEAMRATEGVPNLHTKQTKSARVDIPVRQEAYQVPVITPTTPAREVGDVSVGWQYVCAVVDKKAYCWGDNSSWQLGTGDNTLRTQLTPVQGDLATKQVKKIEASLEHTCAITSTNELYCWGANREYQSDPADTRGTAYTNRKIALPRKVSVNNEQVIDVSTGPGYTCAITISGGLYCWGDGNFGRLGLGATNTDCEEDDDEESNNYGDYSCSWLRIRYPTRVHQGAVPAGAMYTEVETNSQFTCASATVGTNEQLYCFGGENINDWQRSSEVDWRTDKMKLTAIPESVPFKPSFGSTMTVSNVDQISIGGGLYYTICSIVDGSLGQNRLYCWGVNNSDNNRYGMIGNNNTCARLFCGTVKNPVYILPEATTVAAGDVSVCAMSGGRLKCWGSNNDYPLGGTQCRYMLGNNSCTNTYAPVDSIQPASQLTKVDQYQRSQHTCGIGGDKQLYCWGAGGKYVQANGTQDHVTRPTRVDLSYLPSPPTETTVTYITQYRRQADVNNALIY